MMKSYMDKFGYADEWQLEEQPKLDPSVYFLLKET